jgi:uncharacterized protein YcgI (DUF1989 family)
MSTQPIHSPALRHEFTLQGGTGFAMKTLAGQRVHIVNTMGHQVVDTWALTTDGNQCLSMSHTRMALGRINPRENDELVDDLRQPMLRIVYDDSNSTHDTLIPPCDPQRYRLLGHEGHHASCVDNFLMAITPYGYPRPRHVPDALNLFMEVPIDAGGELSLKPSVAPAGSRVVVEALRDLLLVLSACPQDLVAINGADKHPRLIDIFVEDVKISSEAEVLK